MHELGEVKDALDISVKQNFIDPMQNLHDKDLREIQVSSTGVGYCDADRRVCVNVCVPLTAPSEEDGRPPSGLRL